MAHGKDSVLLKHIRLTFVQTPPPLKQIREKEGRGVCTQTKIRKLNRRSDYFNWIEDVYIPMVFSPQSLLFPGFKDFERGVVRP